MFAARSRGDDDAKVAGQLLEAVGGSVAAEWGRMAAARIAGGASGGCRVGWALPDTAHGLPQAVAVWAIA